MSTQERVTIMYICYALMPSVAEYMPPVASIHLVIWSARDGSKGLTMCKGASMRICYFCISLAINLNNRTISMCEENSRVSTSYNTIIVWSNSNYPTLMETRILIVYLSTFYYAKIYETIMTQLCCCSNRCYSCRNPHGKVIILETLCLNVT